MEQTMPALRKGIFRARRYPIVDGREAIEIKVKSLNQLFDDRDPAPFREKDLDDEAVEYIVSSVLDVSPHKVKRLLIFHDPIHDSHLIRNDVRSAIHQFFSYEVRQADIKIRNILKNGVKSLIIGLCFLMLATLVSYFLSEDSKSFWILFFKEGVLLLGWVSMWKPINIFLYEWWPVAAMKKVFICLSAIPIDFILSETESTSYEP